MKIYVYNVVAVEPHSCVASVAYKKAIQTYTARLLSIYDYLLCLN